MNNDYSLTIKIPSGDEPLIEYGRHFNVQGRIIHKDDLPEDAVLNVSLIDEAGRVIRYARQTRKNNVNVYLSHPQLTCYTGSGKASGRMPVCGQMQIRDADMQGSSAR